MYFFLKCKRPIINNLLLIFAKIFYFIILNIFDTKVKNKTNVMNYSLINKRCWRGYKWNSYWKVFDDHKRIRQVVVAFENSRCMRHLPQNHVTTLCWVLKRKRLINDQFLEKILYNSMSNNMQEARIEQGLNLIMQEMTH